METKAIPVDHSVSSLVSSNPKVAKTRAEKMAIRGMQRDGPCVWDRVLPTTLDLKPGVYGVNNLSFLTAKATRVDQSGSPVKGSNDYHSYIEEQGLYFRTLGARDMYLEAYDQEMNAKTVDRLDDESKKDYEARLLVEYRKNAIRFCLNEICKKYGCTLKDLEDKKAIYNVSCRL